MKLGLVFGSPKLSLIILEFEKNGAKTTIKKFRIWKNQAQTSLKEPSNKFYNLKIKNKDSLKKEELHNIGFCHGTNLGVGSPKALELDMEHQTYQACAKAQPIHVHPITI